ncbi:hypothetical protein [Paraburkholderia sp. GAS448]|jgi:hypothetical protein|uniref:hypothetical protein n=1 Tax=Paraburkholderia sp. GAS448 TaxID=3035136 RepID=UPI003D248DFF
MDIGIPLVDTGDERMMIPGAIEAPDLGKDCPQFGFKGSLIADLFQRPARVSAKRMLVKARLSRRTWLASREVI